VLALATALVAGGRTEPGAAPSRAAAATAPAAPAAGREDPQRRALDRIVEAEAALARAAPTARAVALTFDDGPGSQTERFLAALRRLGVHATFFVIGRQIGQQPQILRDIVRGGHAVGNHTWDHPDLRRLSVDKIHEEVEWTRDAIRDAAGVDAVLLRPPFGGVDARVLQALAPFGLATVLWDLDPHDWEGLRAEAITRNVLADVHPGAIILLHDGGGDRAQTLAALPAIVAGLRARGYRFMTVPQLLAAAPPAGSALVRARGGTPA
jgi:peptidoglycan/xylan/chitin deacetylase (PgdA/CDA1 family)